MPVIDAVPGLGGQYGPRTEFRTRPGLGDLPPLPRNFKLVGSNYQFVRLSTERMCAATSLELLCDSSAAIFTKVMLTFCELFDDGIKKNYRVPTGSDEPCTFLGSLDRDAHGVVEASTNSFRFSEMMAPFAGRVVVSDPGAAD